MGHGKIYPPDGGKTGGERAYLRGGKRYLRACHTFRVPGGNGEDHAAVGGDLITRVFAAGRKYPKECKAARVDIERRITGAINEWMREEK